jgi:hypothetical protein
LEKQGTSGGACRGTFCLRLLSSGRNGVLRLKYGLRFFRMHGDHFVTVRFLLEGLKLTL